MYARQSSHTNNAVCAHVMLLQDNCCLGDGEATPERLSTETSQQLGTGLMDGEMYTDTTVTADSKLSPPLDADATRKAAERKLCSPLDADATVAFERQVSSLLTEDTTDADNGKSSSAPVVAATVVNNVNLSQTPNTANQERTKQTQASPRAPRGTVTETWRLLSSHRLPASCETSFSH